MARTVPALVVVALLAGCDNIHWGGTEICIVPPPPRADEVEAVAKAIAAAHLPSGPVLYLARRQDADDATLIPLGEIVRDSLRALGDTAHWERFGEGFVAKHLARGAEFTLFSQGARVGTFVVQSVAIPDAAACPPVPRATGNLELSPAAGQTNDFIALAKADAAALGPAPAIPPAVPQRTRTLLAPNLADALLRRRGAPLPDNWARATAQVEPLPFAGQRDHGFTATFLLGDTLGPGLDDDGYSLFFIASPDARAGFDTVFVRFADYAVSGKAAPRLVDFLDWNRDGQAGLLLEVFGTTESWLETVAMSRNGWRNVLEIRCARS